MKRNDRLPIPAVTVVAMLVVSACGDERVTSVEPELGRSQPIVTDTLPTTLAAFGELRAIETRRARESDAQALHLEASFRALTESFTILDIARPYPAAADRCSSESPFARDRLSALAGAERLPAGDVVPIGSPAGSLATLLPHAGDSGSMPEPGVSRSAPFVYRPSAPLPADAFPTGMTFAIPGAADGFPVVDHAEIPDVVPLDIPLDIAFDSNGDPRFAEPGVTIEWTAGGPGSALSFEVIAVDKFDASGAATDFYRVVCEVVDDGRFRLADATIDDRPVSASGTVVAGYRLSNASRRTVSWIAVDDETLLEVSNESMLDFEIR